MSRPKSMKPKVLGPYTEADVQQWDEALDQCQAAILQCQLGMQAGFTCDDQLRACEALKAQLRQMKSTFAPGMP